jgi:hypothetical protein
MFIKKQRKSYFTDGLQWALPWGFPIQTIHSMVREEEGGAEGDYPLG